MDGFEALEAAYSLWKGGNVFRYIFSSTYRKETNARWKKMAGKEKLAFLFESTIGFVFLSIVIIASYIVFSNPS